MTRLPIIATALLLLTGTATVLAQADAITQRQNIMKGVGAAARAGSQLARGQAPYDEARAREVLTTFQQAGQNYGGLFPDGSQAGTKAAPAIFSDRAGFQAANKKFADDATAALGQTGSQATFAAAFGQVAANCNSCHEKYRLP